ncbi:MAG: 3'-5' exonuclease, partial [Balneolaceae bacterium]
DEKHLNYLHDTKAPLRINYRDGVQNKAESKRHVFQLAATQVAALIDKGKREEVKIGDTPLQAGDIAILVTTNRDAETLKEYLKSRGVDSVTYSREQVFESREADRLRHLMSAVLYPSDRRRVARSLVSGFFGSEIEHLHELYQNEERWQNLVEKLRRLNERWHEAGFYPMFRKFLFEEKALTNLAKIHNSERVITNLQQLAEICSYAEQEHKFDPSGLYNWFYKQAANPQENDEQTLLLESDRQLVKISTIHNSKGLEFPVVFLPTLWDAKDLGRKGQPVAEYHDPENRYHAMLNVDQGKSITRSKAEFRSHLESVAEEVRKTYVALTRAKYECRVFWSATKNSHLSGLGAALLGKEYVTHCIEKMESLEKSDRISQQFFRNKFEQFSKRLPGIISFHDPHPEESNGGKRQEISPENVRESLTLSSITLPESLYSNKQLYSFSSLIHNDPERVAEPDYDQWLEKYIERANKDRDSGEEEATIFSFPKGALAGTLIHKLFEHSEFDFRDPGNKLGFIRDNLLEYGFDEKWIQPLHKMMINVSKADYSGLNMNKVSPENLMREMEFYFDSAQLTVEDFIQVIRSGQVSAQSGRVDVKGYVTGFIDLIVRQHGVYYILDYKSNYLGDSLQDYQKEQLQEVMISTGYDIQYHLYTLALKKYLESRDPDFDYEKHFGGTYYLFVRGIRANSGSGIYQHKPELKILESLEKLLYRDREVQGG